MSPKLANLRFLSMDPADDAGAVALHFAPRRPLRYHAGQHGLWMVPGSGVKAFTIASAPEEDVITLGTSLASGSRFKRALAGLIPGSRARLVGPLSSFTLDRTAPRVVMLAQGMGVTPFRSILRHVKLSGADKHTTLIHVGARHPFRFDTEPAVVTSAYPTSREAFAKALQDVTRSQPDATFMIFGASAFVSSTIMQLKTCSVPSSQMRRDTFYGYTAPEPPLIGTAHPRSRSRHVQDGDPAQDSRRVRCVVAR